MTNRLSLRAVDSLPIVAPSILAADFGRMNEECGSVLGPAGDGRFGGVRVALHLDVMDGHFVPNLTMGPDMCKALRRTFPAALLDVHLMVTDPAAYVEPFAKAGADHLTFHIEVVPPPAVAGLAARIRDRGMTAGIAINPPTPVERILPVVGEADLILVMSVNPGFAGQAFIPEVLSKVRAIRPLLRPDQRLEMDGGIGTGNAKACRDAGCDVLVGGSSVFGVPAGGRLPAMAALAGTA